MNKLLLPTETRDQIRKKLVESWIGLATAGDHNLGRGDHNWAAPPTPMLKKLVPAFKDKGINVYVGGGQFLLVDMKPKNPLVIQRRPLAQRYVEIIINE